MKETTPTTSDAKIARRNYLFFSLASALVLTVIVSVTTLVLTG